MTVRRLFPGRHILAVLAAGIWLAAAVPAQAAGSDQSAVSSPVRFNLAAAAAENPAAGGPAAGAAPGQAAGGEAPLTTYTPPPSAYMLMAGTIIPGTLITGVNSDLPGQVVAQVRQNVYDSVSGNYLLVPQGARLIGEYGGAVGAGRDRINVYWKRMILPNGVSVNLGSMASVDSGGYVGLRDKVNDHMGSMLNAVILSSALAYGVAMASGDGSVVKDSDGNVTETAKQSAVRDISDNISDIGSKIVDKQLGMAPTIIIRPGFQFDVFVNRDVVLRPY